MRFLATLALASLANAAGAASSPEEAAVAASPRDIAALIARQDDANDPTIRLSTEPFYVRAPSAAEDRSDKYLVASVDRQDGHTRFEVVGFLDHIGDPAYDSARFDSPTGFREAPIKILGHDIVKRAASVIRMNRDYLSFDVPEPVLRAMAKDAAGGTGLVWKFGFHRRSGETEWAQMLCTEIAGLLLAVDQERQALSPAR